MTTSMFIDRYHAGGLSCNPFACEALTGGDGAPFVDRGLAAPPAPSAATLVQVIGAKGVGKTTHVIEWRRRAPGPYHYVPRVPKRDRWHAPPVAPLVYADEIDRMPWPVRWRWFNKLVELGATVVAGTHRDLAAPARRAGFSVVTHHLGAVDLATLTTIVETRMRSAGLADGPRVQLLRDEDLVDVHARSGGNLRAAEQLLHDIVAERVSANEPCWSPT